MSAADQQSAPGAFAVHRYADQPYTRAFIPGDREPRSVAVGDEVGGDLQAVPLGVCARPPRRIELGRPVPLLRHVTLVDTPVINRIDEAYAEVTADVAGHGDILLFVTESGRPLHDSETDLLERVSRDGTPVMFARLGAQPAGSPRDRRPAAGRVPAPGRVPALGSAPSYRVDLPGDVAALRQALIGLAGAARPGRAAQPLVPDPGTGRRQGWRPTLDREIGRCRLAALRQLAGDLAATQDRCHRRTSGRDGFRLLPDALDRELHALSVRLTLDLDASYHRVAERTLTAALGRPPSSWQYARVADDVRAACAGEAEEVLLVTSTGGVTTLRGPGSRAGLSAHPTPPGTPVVRPIEIALTAGCYLLWRHRANAHPAEMEVWSQRAIDSVAAELLDEVVTRCHDIHRALIRSVDGLLARRSLVGGPRSMHHQPAALPDGQVR